MKNNCMIFFILLLFIFGCNEATLKKNEHEIINKIIIEDFRKLGGASPVLIFSEYKTQLDTNYFWLFNIKVSAYALVDIKTKSLEYCNNLRLSNSNSENSFHINIYYSNTNKKESIELPLEKGVEYFNLLIKILQENNIKDLDIAVKKLNYMKD